MPSIQGQLLIASPHLPDPNFFRSVVLIVQHDEQGAVGVILNRPTDSAVDELWELECEEACPEPVYLGGPVSERLMAIHTNRGHAEDVILPGVYVTTTVRMLERIVRDTSEAFVICKGYAGWAAGQLEGELEMGGWLTKTTTAAEIFGQDEDLWKSVVQEIGLEIIAPSLKGRLFPADPSLN